MTKASVTLLPGAAERKGHLHLRLGKCRRGAEQRQQHKEQQDPHPIHRRGYSMPNAEDEES
jgi:hypothetical protein